MELAYGYSGIISLLISTRWFTEENGKIRAGEKLPLDFLRTKNHFQLRKVLLADLFSYLKQENIVTKIFDLDAFDFDFQKNQIVVLGSAVPLSASGVRNLLISIGCLASNANQPNHYYVSTEYQVFFEEEIISWLHSRTLFNDDSGTSFERYKEIQRLKEEAGLAAEEFVINYEKKRLEKHPSSSRIKHVSKIKVEAGYDIASFQSLSSNNLDKFIEVKSYSRKLEFYLSKNELLVSEMKRDQYFLYLVDRDEMDKPDYRPEIVQDPYTTIFLNEEWVKNPQNWRIEPKTRTSKDK